MSKNGPCGADLEHVKRELITLLNMNLDDTTEASTLLERAIVEMKILLDDVNELELKLEVEQQSSLLCHSHIEELVHIKDEHEYNEQRKKQSTS